MAHDAYFCKSYPANISWGYPTMRYPGSTHPTVCIRYNLSFLHGALGTHAAGGYLDDGRQNELTTFELGAAAAGCKRRPYWTYG